jgi:hypothetical protein
MLYYSGSEISACSESHCAPCRDEVFMGMISRRVALAPLAAQPAPG